MSTEEPVNERVTNTEMEQNNGSDNSNSSNDCDNSVPYSPPVYHWFYERLRENKSSVWIPFSVPDSTAIEEAFVKSKETAVPVVSTNGDRYDVNVIEKTRRAVYWTEEPTRVQRCLWFHRAEGRSRFVPYSEEFCEKLEQEYKNICLESKWHRKIDFGDRSQFFIFNGPNSIVEYTLEMSPDQWHDASESHFKPKQVRRGIDESLIETGEAHEVDHLVFLVHGVGSFCDFKFRGLTEVVDEFRSMSSDLLRNHFKEEREANKVRRVEYLPVSWHTALHGDATGIDERLKLITLQSIPKLRNFSNDTILDALFYTSPMYCQTIIDAVASEMNRLFKIFRHRNPSFKGRIAVVGHSLGSLILFDVLAHQNEWKQRNRSAVDRIDEVNDITSLCSALNLNEYLETFLINDIEIQSLPKLSQSEFDALGISSNAQKSIQQFFENQTSRHSTRDIQSSESLSRKSSVASVNYNFGSPGTGHPFIKYPQLDFAPDCFFALGSPIAMFLTVRGIETLKNDFKLPTCPRVFNIFHPFDPVAYRIEPMIDPVFSNVKPVLIPHHKGRKRMHLELKENFIKVGTDIKHMVVESLKSTWNSISDFARAHQSTSAQLASNSSTIEQSNDETERMNTSEMSAGQSSNGSLKRRRYSSENEMSDEMENLNCGQLNSGHRIDYVLQEAPIEFINEYIFALATHCCYWESEDTALLLLKELYS